MSKKSAARALLLSSAATQSTPAPAESTPAPAESNVVKITRNPILEYGRTYQIAPGLLTVEQGYNIRQFDESNPDDASMMASIRYSGVHTPLVIRQDADGVYIVVEGHMRRAASLALLDKKQGKMVATVPVMLERPGMTAEERTLGLWRSNSGKPLTPMQQGIVCVRLRDVYKWVDKRIAQSVGKSTKHINTVIALARSPDAVQDMVRAGQVSDSLAIKVLDGGNTPEQTVVMLTLGLANARKAGADRLTEKFMVGVPGWNKKAATPKVDEPKVDEPKVDEPKADQPITPVTTTSPSLESTPDESKADESKADESKARDIEAGGSPASGKSDAVQAKAGVLPAPDSYRLGGPNGCSLISRDGTILADARGNTPADKIARAQWLLKCALSLAV